MAAKNQQRNEVVNRQCAELAESLKLRGYRSCVLKGQGVAALYKLRDLLSHIYRHLFGLGIGLRQLMDYYFALKTLPSSLFREVNDTLK